MTTINTIGLRIVGITVVIALALFGLWKGIEFGILKYKISQVSNINETSPSISPTPYTTSRQDVESLTPEFTNELSSLADTAQQTLVGYTKQYIESLPANAPKEQVLDQRNLQSFIDANKGTLLPELSAGTVKTTQSSGKKAIQIYLDAISASHNTTIAPITGDAIIAALNKQQGGEELEALAPIRSALEKNFSLFSSVQAPQEAVPLHTKLLQATQSLITTVKLLQEMRYDTVAGLIGQRNLTDLNAVFSDIASQILALETKYDIK